MASIFEQRAAQLPGLIDSDSSKYSGKGSIFQTRAREIQQDESFGKSAVRTAVQVPLGLAEGTPYGIATNLWQALGTGESLDPEEIEQIKKISDRVGIPFNEESYMNAVQNASNSIPTVGNIASKVEEKTGIPLEARTRFQKGLKFASTATKLIPKANPTSPQGYAFRGTNTALPRPVLGAGVEGARETMIELGVPEPIADIASFAIVKPTTANSNKLSIGKETKESGLPTRRYESIKEPTQVSASRAKIINDKVEGDFRKISEDIIKESPVGETYNSLKEDASFKKISSEKFEEVNRLAENIPGKFSSKEIKDQLRKKYKSKESSGLTPSEYDIEYSKFMKQFEKNTPTKDATPTDIVKQYRKNNESLGEQFEPGKSKGYNRAKKEALLDYNEILADTIQNKYPDTEFSKIFKESNKRWSEIKSSEFINEFIDDLFEGKVNFSEGKKFYDKNTNEQIQRALGKEGYQKFDQLMGDLMSTEQANKFLKKATDSGYPNLAKTATSYILHPKLAAAKVGFDVLKTTYRSLLDKPRLAITWEEGLKAIKKGDFKKAEVKFDELNKSLTPKQEAVKDFKKHQQNQVIPDFGKMGNAISDNFYSGIFKSLKEGKDTFSGIKDPLIQAAKPSFDAGLIKNESDLKKFANTWKNQSPKPKTK